MPVRRFKPTSPGRRHMSVSDFAEITKSKPEKALTEKLTKKAAALLAEWGQQTPIVIVVTEEEAAAEKSFRNLERVLVTSPSELEVAAVVWARALLVSEAALPLVQGRANG